MYKVFFNDRILYLSNSYPNDNPNQYDVIEPYADNEKLQKTIERFENSDITSLLIYADDEEYLFRQVASFYSIVNAGGGLVADPNERFLLIFRRGKWDLPKGKAEKNESIEETALREVIEETNLQDLNIRHFITDTYHTYYEKKKPILKKTSWYLMQNHGSEDLIPQVKEDITHVLWVEKEKLPGYMENTYGSILEVVKKEGVI